MAHDFIDELDAFYLNGSMASTEPKHYLHTVWLVRTEAGYIHCGFTTQQAARAFCTQHAGYYVASIPVYRYQPE